MLLALASPELEERRIHGTPFGGTEAADWAPPAMSLASIATAFLEPDPTVTWDEERLARVRREFEELAAEDR